MMHWPDGPWKREESAVAWVDSRTGLNCAMIRNHFGTWCGYVSVAPGHPLHGKHYHDSVQIPMTYMDTLSTREIDVERDIGFINLLLAASDPDEGCDRGHIALTLLLPAHHGLSYTDADADGAWWFGFDCGHAGDLMPYLSFDFMRFDFMKDWVYRDRDYVYGIATRLAWTIEEVRQAIDISDDDLSNETKYQASDREPDDERR